jgi:hypothetical protein
MEPFDRSDPGRKRFHRVGKTMSHDPVFKKERKRIQTPQAYGICDGLTEALLYFLVVFTPWAFGTTQTWSIWTANIAAYILGLLLLIKWLIRWQTGYQPLRWGEENAGEQILIIRQEGPRVLTILFAGLTILVLTNCVISAWNARATYLPDQHRFEYHDFISWLPHSYDSSSTWNVFWSFLGMALVFWTIRDWLLGKSSRDHQGPDFDDSALRPEFAANPAKSEMPSSPLPIPHTVPSRLRRLLWVLCVNGAVLALEGILQRLDGTNKLLWLIEPRFNNTAESQFGPYAYRANAASYFNLIWPVCIGFWLILSKQSAFNSGRRFGGGSHIVLLPCAVVMAAAPVITTSRGGALVTLALMLGTMGMLLLTICRETSATRLSALVTLVCILGFAGYLGWQQFQPRIETIFADEMSQRTEIYKNAGLIARDFPLFGTGPGTFGSVYQLYKDPPQTWAAYAHDDWLETRITFGWVGFGLILLMLCLVIVRWFFGEGIGRVSGFAAMIGLSLCGCLLHARFDFPFQIHSILLLFILLSSILFCLSRRDANGAST